MKTLLIILCIIIVVKYWPYIIAFPFAIVKAVYYIVTGRDNDPEIVELKEAKKARDGRQERGTQGKAKTFLEASFVAQGILPLIFI